MLPDSVGGVASFVYNLLKFNKNKSIYTKVILYKLQEDKTHKVELQYNVNEQIHFSYSGKENKYYILKDLKKHISSPESIIVANDGLELSLINTFKLENPLFFIVHGDNDYYYSLVKQYQTIINKIITVSNYIKSNISKKFANVETVYAPVVISAKCNNDKISRKNLNIVFVGKITENKGIFELLEIIKFFQTQDENTQFTIIGDGDKFKYVNKVIANYNNVICAGQLSHYELNKCYSQADILLLPSYSEGLPLVVVESMKYGCVPICNNIPSGIPEIIENEITGFVVENNCIKKYCEIIIDLHKNRNKLQIIGKNAQKFANDNFDESTQSKKYFDIFLNSSYISVNKEFKKLPIGGILNQKYFPNFLVKFMRNLINHPKL